MFKQNKKGTSFGKIETLISQDTKLNGKIEASGTLRIDGTVCGGIQKAEGVIIGETGIVEGDIHCKGLNLGGKIKGNIYCDSTLELLPGSTLIGDIETYRLSIAEGAHFDGVCTMVEGQKDNKKNNKSKFEREIKQEQEPT
ncbi:MAG: bactofilin family protein [Elusimicrobiota bacterium]